MTILRSFILLLILAASCTKAQNIPKEYRILVKQADSLYYAKDYKGSALKFNEAFRSFGNKGVLDDRYSAACSWALSDNGDSAFVQLNILINKGKYAGFDQLSTDADLHSLHNDKRWEPLMETLKANKAAAEAQFDWPLIAQLDSILTKDQSYRRQLSDMEKKFGRNSEEMRKHWRLISYNDSLNLIRVKAVLDQRGWLGPDIVGDQGNSTLFLVIQHSDPLTQRTYLPMMREAVRSGKARGSDLALLEDRVALGLGKKQIYGSQIGTDEAGGYYVLPLEDPDNVDKRRQEVGLGPLTDYVSNWSIKWDPAKYKKDLPKYMEDLKQRK